MATLHNRMRPIAQEIDYLYTVPLFGLLSRRQCLVAERIREDWGHPSCTLCHAFEMPPKVYCTSAVQFPFFVMMDFGKCDIDDVNTFFSNSVEFCPNVVRSKQHPKNSKFL